MDFLAIDLHIHSLLSPCADREMTPPNIITRAKDVGLEAIVIADHNSAENQQAFLELGKRMGIKILPGIEVQSREDVHLLCIFDSLEQVLRWQHLIYENLPSLENNKEIFGFQEVVDSQGRKIGENNRLLLAATSFSIDAINEQVTALGGLVLPAHIDRPSFSLWNQMGFLKDEFNFIGVELTPHLKRKKEQLEFIRERNLGVVISTDAHQLSQIKGPYTRAYLEDFTVQELTIALKREQGRSIKLEESLLSME